MSEIVSSCEMFEYQKQNIETDSQEQILIEREHFLRHIQQMKNNAVLIRKHEDGRLEPVFVSEEFAKMMEALC